MHELRDSSEKNNPLRSEADHQDALINKLTAEKLFVGSKNSGGDLLGSVQAPDGVLNRYGIVTAQGLGYLPQGMWNSVKHNWNNPMEAATTFGMGAGMALVLKTVLPEGGLAGKVAAGAIGAYFTYKSAEPIMQSYAKAKSATTMHDLDLASKDLGNALGTFVVDSAIAGAGYKVGSHYAGRMLSSQAFDGFADQKADFYAGLERTGSRLVDKLSLGQRAIDAGPTAVSKLGAGEQAIAKFAERTPLDTGTQMELSVLLKSRSSDLRIERTLARISEGRQQPLNDAQFAQSFAARPESLNAVKSFASQNGLQVKDANLNSGRVVLAGTSEQLSHAFGTRLSQYRMPDGLKFFAPEKPVSLPAALDSHVNGVLGLNNRFQAQPNFIKHAVPPAGATAEAGSRRPYLPNEVADAYNFPKQSMGEGQSVAIIQLGGGLDRIDNAKYYQRHGLKEPKINVIEVGEAKSKPGHAFDSEVMLDSQVIGAVASGATQNIIFAANSERGFADAILRATFPEKGELPNNVISISWGLYENGWSKDGIAGMNSAFKKAALKGISVFASAGDDGVRDRVSNGKFNAHYPASDPNVTAAGCTRLQVDGSGKRTSEVVWNNNRQVDAGGGGISEIFPVPEYQKGINIPLNANTGKPGRGYPDITGNADPVTGYIIRVHGAEEVMGGTSAVAPLYAALMLRINGALGKPVAGPLNPWLYQNRNAGFFNDITAGDNGGYKAEPGWDAASGLGSINGTLLLEALRANPYVIKSPLLQK